MQPLTALPISRLRRLNRLSKNGKSSAMRVNLKGVHSIRKTLADGREVIYRYAWRGGPSIKADPGSPEFLAEYQTAVATRCRPNNRLFLSLIVEFKESAEFAGKSRDTQRAYRYYLKMIETKFGDMPIEALSDPEVRGEFKRWRDGMAATPRKADYAWTTIARVLSIAKDRGRITINPCERGGRLYAADRADRIWTADDIKAFREVASAELQAALLLALWTGQRQGDLLRLTWNRYDGAHIRLRQSKNGERVLVPVGAPLKAALDASGRRKGLTILTNSRGGRWTSDGFRASWGRAAEKAGIIDLHFHDLRGTAVTRLAVAGCTVPQIAAITGHSLKDVEAILDAHYLGGKIELAEAAIVKLNAAFGT